jgi:hypothetical protein
MDMAGVLKDVLNFKPGDITILADRKAAKINNHESLT